MDGSVKWWQHWAGHPVGTTKGFSLGPSALHSTNIKAGKMLWDEVPNICICMCNSVSLSLFFCSHCIHQILESVNHIHQHDIVHRDLKVIFPLCHRGWGAARASLEEARQELRCQLAGPCLLYLLYLFVFILFPFTTAGHSCSWSTNSLDFSRECTEFPRKLSFLMNFVSAQHLWGSSWTG